MFNIFGKKKPDGDKNKEPEKSQGESTNLKGNQVLPVNQSNGYPQSVSQSMNGANNQPKANNLSGPNDPNQSAIDQSTPEGDPAAEPKKKGLMGSLGDNIKKGYQSAKEGVKNVAKKVKDNTLDAGNSLMSNDFVKKYGVDTYNDVKGKLADLKEDIANEISNSEYFKKMKFKLNRFVILKLEKLIDAQLNKLAEVAKKSTDDPDMCGSVKRLKDDLIDEFYPDLKDEIMFMLKMQVSQPYLDLEDPPRRCCLIQFLYSFRAWVLYTLDPVDRSIWYNMKTFSWWFLQLFQAFPFYGVQTFFLLFYFLLMCKTDEYQLVNYIVSFKKLQFLTMGCMNGLIAYIIYFFCISTSRGMNDVEGVNACSAKGDSDVFHYWIEVGTFGLKILLVWLSYFLLPYSERKGQVSFRIQSDVEKQKDEVEKKKCYCFRSGGGRLSKLMIWEFFTVLIVVGIFLILYFFVIKNEKVSMRESIYFCQIMYGLLSFPFLVFSIPMMTVILTKSRETTYDSFGRCVPNIPSLHKIKEKEKARDLKKSNSDEGEDLARLIADDKADFFKELENNDTSIDQGSLKGNHSMETFKNDFSLNEHR